MSDAVSNLHRALVQGNVDVSTLTASELARRPEVSAELRSLSPDELLSKLQAVEGLRGAANAINLGPRPVGQRNANASGPGSALDVRVGQQRAADARSSSNGPAASAPAPAAPAPAASTPATSAPAPVTAAATVSPAEAPKTGDAALKLFRAAFEKQLAEGNWEQDGATVRLSGKEATVLKTEYLGLLEALPNSAERASFRNGVAELLASFKGNKQENLTAERLWLEVDKAFQAKLAPGGIRLEEFKEGIVSTDIDLSGVNNAFAATNVFAGILQCHMRDAKSWTVSEKDGPEYASWQGDVVRIVSAETNRLKALIEEIFAVLPQAEAQAFHDNVADLLKALQGSRYEEERKFPDLLRFLEQAVKKA